MTANHVGVVVGTKAAQAVETTVVATKSAVQGSKSFLAGLKAGWSAARPVRNV
jgi:hypothetical protein